MRAFVEVIGPGSADSSSSIQLFFDEARYLFECGDGTQRICTEHGIKLGRLRGIYLTSLAAPSTGGLFGLFLTIADAGKQEISITGPEGLKRLFSGARSFYRRPTLEQHITELDIETPPQACPIEVTEDENITIQAVPVKSRRDIEIDRAFGAHFDCLTYICRLPDIRGKFNPQRAMELGVKKGRNFGILQKGGNVTLDDGAVVKPCDVMSPSTPGPVVVIAACPTLDHIESFTSAHALNPVELGLLSRQGTEVGRTALVCHLAPLEVLENPSYRQWCDSLGPETSHIPLHHSVTPARTVFTAQAEDTALLHYSLDKELFPLPADCFAPNQPTAVSEARAQSGKESKPLTSALVVPVSNSPREPSKMQPYGRVGEWIDSDCRLKFVLSPPVNAGLDKSAVRSRYLTPNFGIPLRPWRNVSSPYSGEPMPDAPESEVPYCISALSPRTVGVRFFGTGAAIPGKHRNVSSTMLDMFERGGVMFDCGEGTWGQMVRHFGMGRAQRALCMMKVIFISHMHADHHLGLLTILHERTKAIQAHQNLGQGPQLVVIGPIILQSWLETFQQAAKVPLQNSMPPKRRSYAFRDAKSLTDPQSHDASVFEDSFGLRIGCVPVDHCPLSYGVVIEDVLRRWKVVYSGDTRPCEELARAGKDATLAIHEATFEDELASEAEEKMHSTTSQALEVCSSKMKAWRTILTHFSQRYPKVPRLDDKILQKFSDGRASIAFDLMFIDFIRLRDLPRIMPALKDTFFDEQVESVPEVFVPPVKG